MSIVNLPDINWQTEAIHGHQYNSAINSTYRSAFQDLCLSQIVDFPTRQQSLLDVFLTNRPTLVRKCMSMPGLSDHDMVLTVADVRPRLKRPVERKIHLWDKANIQEIRDELQSFADAFLSHTSIDTPIIRTQWSDIKVKLLFILDDKIPTKLSSRRYNQPWITRDLKPLSRRKKRAFQKLGRLQRNDLQYPELQQKYIELKKKMQRECRKQHQKYMQHDKQ